MELCERLLKLIEFFEKNSQTQFAKKIGVSQATFWDYLNPIGQLKIRKSLLDKINLVYPQVSRDWLFFGEGEMLKSDTPANEVAPAAPARTPAPAAPDLVMPPAAQPVPLVGFASCSIFGWHGTMSIPVPVEPPTWHPGMFAVMATGESMLPAGIGHGHICYCDPNKAPGKDEAVYVETLDGLGTIKLFCGRSARGGEEYLNLRGWLDIDQKTGTQKPMLLDVLASSVTCVAPVMYVRRRL